MIEYIKIGDKEFPFLYSISASTEAEKINTKQDAISISKEYLYLGFKWGGRLVKKDFPYSPDEFGVLCETDPAVFFETSKVFEKQLGKLMGEVGATKQPTPKK